MDLLRRLVAYLLVRFSRAQGVVGAAVAAVLERNNDAGSARNSVAWCERGSWRGGRRLRG